MVFHFSTGGGGRGWPAIGLISGSLAAGIIQPFALWVVASQQVRTIVEAQGLVQVFAHQHAALGQTVTKLLGRDLQAAAPVTDRVVSPDHSGLLTGEDLVQVGSMRGNKGGAFLLGLNGEAAIVKGDPLLVEEPIGLLEGSDAFEAQLLRQPALPGPKQPFATSPSLG